MAKKPAAPAVPPRTFSRGERREGEFKIIIIFIFTANSGRAPPPPVPVKPPRPSFKLEDFQFIKVLGKGSFGKVNTCTLHTREAYHVIFT